LEGSSVSLTYYFDSEHATVPEFLSSLKKRGTSRVISYGYVPLHVYGTVSHRSELVNRYLEEHLREAIQAGVDASWLKARACRLRAYISLRPESSSADVELEPFVLRMIADAGATLLIDSL